MSKPRKPANQAVRLEANNSRTSIVASSFEGPLPAPAILEDYDRIQPGLAAEIVSWARDETAHRHSIEQQAIAIDDRLSKSYAREILLGQIFGFLIALAFLGSALYLGIIGREIVASALGTLGIGSIVVAFIVGRKENSKK